MSDENDTLAGAAVALTARPSDANCRVVLFQADKNDLHYEALVRLRGQTLVATTEALGTVVPNSATFTLTGGLGGAG